MLNIWVAKKKKTIRKIKVNLKRKRKRNELMKIKMEENLAVSLDAAVVVIVVGHATNAIAKKLKSNQKVRLSLGAFR